jgi:hypothetical protein
VNPDYYIKIKEFQIKLGCRLAEKHEPSRAKQLENES